MALLKDMPLPDIADWLRRSEIVPFVGAGASISGMSSASRLPTGAGLADELRKRVSYPGSRRDPLAKIAQFYEASSDRSALYAILRKRFFEDLDTSELSPTARFIANIDTTPGFPPRIVVTTNYDNQLERAFAGNGKLYCVITHAISAGHAQLFVRDNDQEVRELKGRLVLTSFAAGTTFIYKMHGTVDFPIDHERNTVIITEDDYVDFLLNSRPAQLPPQALTAEFAKRRFLFLGYSLEDWNFRVMLRLLSEINAKRPLGEFRHYAIQRRPRAIEERLWDQRRVRLYDADLIEFVASIQSIMTENAPGRG